jgi:hypothetical protein
LQHCILAFAKEDATPLTWAITETKVPESLCLILDIVGTKHNESVFLKCSRVLKAKVPDPKSLSSELNERPGQKIVGCLRQFGAGFTFLWLGPVPATRFVGTFVPEFGCRNVIHQMENSK